MEDRRWGPPLELLLVQQVNLVGNLVQLVILKLVFWVFALVLEEQKGLAQVVQKVAELLLSLSVAVPEKT